MHIRLPQVRLLTQAANNKFQGSYGRNLENKTDQIRHGGYTIGSKFGVQEAPCVHDYHIPVVLDVLTDVLTDVEALIDATFDSVATTVIS